MQKYEKMIRKNVKGSPFPNLALNNIMKKYGAHRVSEEARIELRKILELRLEDITQKAAQIAKHSKRKTINGGDVRIANR
ncbi:MAG: histone [Candidatus Woesearchaeota archaeon]